MDAPFEKKEEGRRKDIAEIFSIGHFAVNAARHYQQQLEDAAPSEINVNDAINLIGNYVYGRMLISMHFSSADSIPFDEQHAQSIVRRYSKGDDPTERGRAAKAIKDAQEGSYSSMKSYVVEDAAEMKHDMEHNLADKDLSKLVGTMLELERLIPVKSEYKLKPPLPPHLNPQFNPDASPPPPDLIQTQG